MGMNRIFSLFLLGLSFACAFVSIAQEDALLDWRTKKLSWNDFQGDVPDDSEFAAITHSAISLDFEGEGVTLRFDIKAYFNQNKSWKKRNVNTYILNHEQLHFDITEYHARLLRRDLKNFRYQSFETVEQDVLDMFNAASDAANKMQLLYDDQTNHSLDKKKQKKWDKKMKKLLKQTSSYSNPIIKVNISYLRR